MDKYQNALIKCYDMSADRHINITHDPDIALLLVSSIDDCKLMKITDT